MANRRFIDFPIASTVGDSDIILIWQSGANKQTTKATFLSGLPENLEDLNDVVISGLTNGQILRYDSVTGKWENTDQGNLDLNDLNDVSIVSPSNGQVLVYNSSTSKWENSSGGYVPYTGAVTTVNLGAQTIQAGQFVKAGGTSAQFLKADGSVDSNVYGTGTVTSVALTMPSAFSVANSPITTAGTLAVTGAGTVGQYIRGDGSLADFPESSGGGSSVSYYLNGSVAQGTIGGVAYKELNKVPVLGAGTDFTINADGYIASFLTDAGDPNLLEIPGGNWNFETYFSASSSGGTPTFYVELYKYNGTTFTLIASSVSAPEFIAFGTTLTPYFSSLAVPTTTLALTDRLAVRYYVNHSGRTITLHTENNHLCQIITTFTTGITALNGLTAQVQNFAVGTSGTDFNIASATATHTFNLPTASATNRGALSSADWTTFNNKTSNLGTVTSVGLSSATSGVTIGSSPVTTSGTITLAIATASGSQNGLLSSTDWTTFNSKQNALTNPVTGTGNTNYLAKFTSNGSTIGNSQIFDNGTNVGINTNTPSQVLEVNGTGLFTGASITGNTKNGVYIFDSNIISLSGSLGRDLAIQAQNLYFFTGTTYGEKMRIFSDGNVLIQNGGTFTNNGARLQVVHNGNSPLFISTSSTTLFTTYQSNSVVVGYIGNGDGIVTSGGTTNFGIRAENDLIFTSGGNNRRMTITSGGNVGIGTASPVNILEISTASKAVSDRTGVNLTTSNSSAADLGLPLVWSSNGSISNYATASISGRRESGTSTNYSGYLQFATTTSAGSLAERMRITSGGYLKASNTGTYSSSTGPYHEMINNVFDDWATIIRNTSASPYGLQISYSSSPNSTANQFIWCPDGTAVRFEVRSNGDVRNFNNSYGSLSDIKLKENIQDATDKLDDLLKVKIRNYNLIGDDKKQIGVIAQELEKVFPNMVDEVEDFEEVEVPQLDKQGNRILNEEGKEIFTKERVKKGTTTKSVKYSVFVPMLIKAIQELKQEIDTLKN